jgi:GT2 family glycosyltransferase
MGTDPERISVIISTKSRPADLARCIQSLGHQNIPPFELLVIDAAEDPLPESFFTAYQERFPVRNIRAEVGLTAARNLGVREAQGEILLFLDDDIELEQDYLEKIRDVFSSDISRTTGGVSGCIVGSSENPPPSVMRKIRVWGRSFIGRLFFLSMERDGFFQPAGFPTWLPAATQKILDTECLYGANMAFRKEVLLKYPFDESLEGYCFMEDDDIAYRVSREYRNRYTPYALLRHFESPASRDREYFRKRMLVQNYAYLFRKNFPQTFSRMLAFRWSLIGLLLCDITGFNPEGVRGLLAGIIDISRNAGRMGRC